MIPNDRELSLYAKIEKLEKALAIAKHCLKDIAQCTDENGVSVEQTMAQNALYRLEKELG